MTDVATRSAIGVADLVDALNATLPRDRRLHLPTEQQRLVIEAPADEPALVVAGAGSGKTETMAFRVLWLVANGHVRPDDVLGLTFTRKAAGELAERMRIRVAQLRAAGLVPDGGPGDGVDLLDAPRVATYNSFATTIFRDHAALVGFDADAVVLGEAAAWLTAREVVVASPDLRLADADKAIDTLTTAVVRLSAALAEHVADPDDVERMAEDFVALADLPAGGSGGYPRVDELVARIAPLPALVELARRFAEVKRERDAIQYSDQVAVALRIVERFPHVAAELRERSRAVILDEYQDTSVVQARLLSTIFRGSPVMAVGDPHQAIYGWRGASASNLAEFPAWFDGAHRYSLSRSWRNGERILAAANRILEPLAAASAVPVDRLDARPGAGAHPVEVVYPETVADEARAVATWFRDRLAGDRVAPAEPPTSALLLRSRQTLGHFTRALAESGVPYHVLGVGGLLAEPAIADLVAALAVLDDARAGSELIRLLVGSRWRIGAADIAALRSLARWLADHDLAQRRLDDATRASLRDSVVDDDEASLVDALDFLATAPVDHAAVRLAGFGDAGLERLREAGRLFAELRSRPRFDLADLVSATIEALELDIEAHANDARPGGERVFEAFFDAVDDFERLGRGGGIRAFLGWLHEAASRDRLSPRTDPPEPGCVQVLTIHGAKGLEWDLVAVPRLVRDELPGRSADKPTWLALGELPYEFRGDAAALPAFAWRGAESRRDLCEREKAYAAAERERQLLEDRRLAYVAMTRARHRLLLSGSWWSQQSSARPPSVFLRELADAGLGPPLPEASELEARPEAVVEPNPWPRDPLGGRRGRVEAAAGLVRAARDAGVDLAATGRWARDLELLLAERRERRSGALPPPARIPASRFHDFVDDPAGVAAELRRPMPERPYRATRLGTLFHAWVERRAEPDGVEEELDAAPDELDGDLVAVDVETFARLRATFEASPWAARRPLEVEREIHLPFDGRTIVCKIDAVFASESEPGRVEIVDWKTGKAPADAADLERKQLQLALYRLAYARWSGLDPALVDAAFYFVADDRVIRPAHVSTEEELLSRWRSADP